jgi:hypothetical protein
MRIYHYTTVEALALILQSRKLRFTRVDQVDDVREAQTHSGIQFGKYSFVSCWTLQSEESLPQWHMYTKQMEGVRLDLPAYPFLRKRLEPRPEWTGIESVGVVHSPLSLDEVFASSYFVLPVFLDPANFAGPITYVADIAEQYARAVDVRQEADGGVSISVERLPQLVRLKSKEWEFQAEYRFNLFALPAPPLPPEGPGSPAFHNALPNHVLKAMLGGVASCITHIDVDLDPAALDDMVVTTGPLCTPGGRVCVEALVSRFAARARVQPSYFSGRIRARSQ